MTITMDEARELVADQKLWPRVRDFLWDFAAQVHVSWLEGLDNLKGLEQRSGLALLDSPRVKRHILETLGVEPCFHAFPKDDGSRLLLLDGATLESIAKWMGALACAEQLRRVTDGATVRSLKAALPGIYPEVFGFAMYFKSLTVGQFDGLTAGMVVEMGREMLADTLAALPEQLLLRFKLKLPKPPDGQTDKPSNRQTVKPSNLQLLMKLRFPEAYALCC